MLMKLGPIDDEPFILWAKPDGSGLQNPAEGRECLICALSPASGAVLQEGPNDLGGGGSPVVDIG